MRRLLRRRRDDSGHTLVELLAAMSVLGLVLAMVFGTIMIANRTTGDISGRLTSANEAKIAIDSMSRNLRTAVLPQLVSCTTCANVAFVQGSPTSVQFYANNNDDPARLGPTKVTYTLTDGTLTERIQKPDPHAPDDFSYTYCTPGPSCEVRDRVIARGVTSERLFTYFDRSGSPMTSSSLNQSQLSQVDSIDVVVDVASGTESTTLVQRVTLPNADTVPELTPTAAP